MSKQQRILVGTSLSAALIAGIGIVGSTANADTATTTNTAAATTNGVDAGGVRANEAVVESFINDVFNNHHTADAAGYFTPDMAWHGGSIGTVTGRAEVAGLMGAIVTALPDLHITYHDVIAQHDEVVVRITVTGTQTGAILGVPASGKTVSWTALDDYRVSDGKIAEEWAGDDYTAFLAGTGTYTAPWIH